MLQVDLLLNQGKMILQTLSTYIMQYICYFVCLHIKNCYTSHLSIQYLSFALLFIFLSHSWSRTGRCQAYSREGEAYSGRTQQARGHYRGEHSFQGNKHIKLCKMYSVTCRQKLFKLWFLPSHIGPTGNGS